MEIRHSTLNDVATIMEIFEHARKFMAATGNPNQWSTRNHPPKDLILSDIDAGKSYVCVDSGKVVGTFYYDFGVDVEPTYKIIDGAWQDSSAYGVVHRMAGNGAVKGIGAFCLNWAVNRSKHLRVDTHHDNVVLQNLLAKLDFHYCGIIYIAYNNEPRLANEKSLA